MPAKFLIQGHRGARGYLPENTVAGFLKAIDMGVNTLEMDVVISGDSKVVVSHEAWMNDEICSLPDGSPIRKGKGREYNLFHMYWEQIRQFDCGKRGNPRFPLQTPKPSHKPQLGEVITAVENHTRANKLTSVIYNIEIKTEEQTDLYNPGPVEFVDLIDKELRKHKISDRIILQSFDTAILKQVKNIFPESRIGLLVENHDSFEKNLNRLGFKPTFYNPDFTLVSHQLVQTVHGAGIKINPWTVNEKKDLEHLLLLGVDGIITDYPDRLVDLIKNRK